MNKNDFYKELMSQYALDPEKIRMNAIKQAKKPVWQKAVSDYWKPALGAAAAVAVTVAGVSYASRSSAPDITIDQGEVLSASQRLIEAEQDYYNLSNEQPYAYIYATFMEPVSYTEIIMALSAVNDCEEIEIRSLYLGTDILTNSEITEFASESSDSDSIIAAKLFLPTECYRDIQDLSIVYLAELGSEEINDDTFVPIAVEDDDPLEDDHLSITTAVTEKPVVTTTPFSFDAVTETSPEEIPVIGESADSNTTLPPVTTTEEEEEELIEEDEIPVITTTETTTPEETTTTYYRGDVGLLTEIFELNVKNALETYIAGNNVVVLTKDEAYLYTIGGFGGTPRGEALSVSNPKFAYKGDKHIILTGCLDDGKRETISVINLEIDTAYTYDASANIGSCEIGEIRYSEDTDKYFLKAVSAKSTLIYELTVNGGVEFRPLVEIEAPVSLAGYKNDYLYFTISENSGLTRLYSFSCVDGSMVELSSFNGAVKLKRGVDFESFAILSPIDATSFILDANFGTLVPALFDDTVAVVTDGGETFFRTNGIVYKVTGSSSVAEADRIVQFEKTTEQIYIVNEINSEKVVVIRKDDTVW